MTSQKPALNKEVPAVFLKPVQKEGIIRLEHYELPIIVILDLSEGNFRSPDAQTKYGDADNFLFVPLRLDYFDDFYSGARSAWMTAVVLSSPKIPTGAIIALRLRQNNSNSGALNNFEQLNSLIQKATGRHMATWVWRTQLTRQTGTGVNPQTGAVEARKWYKCAWMVGEPSTDNEFLIRNQLGEAYQESSTFENLVPLHKTTALNPHPAELPQQEQKSLPSS